MKKFELVQSQSGHSFGVYEGAIADEAIAAMLADAGSGEAPDSGLVATEVATTTAFAFEARVGGQWAREHAGDGGETYETHAEAMADLPTLAKCLGCDVTEVRVVEV